MSPPRVTQRIGDPDAEDACSGSTRRCRPATASSTPSAATPSGRATPRASSAPPGDGRTIPDIYPNGFLPTIITKPTRRLPRRGLPRRPRRRLVATTLGVNYGNSRFEFREENTANVSYWYEPTNPDNPTGPRFEETAHRGGHRHAGASTRLAFNLDLRGVVDWGVGSGPAQPGDRRRVAPGGLPDRGRRRGLLRVRPHQRPQHPHPRPDRQHRPARHPGLPGLVARRRRSTRAATTTRSTSTPSRSSPDRFLAGAALRFEDYSDFGSTVNGKLSGARRRHRASRAARHALHRLPGAERAADLLQPALHQPERRRRADRHADGAPGQRRDAGLRHPAPRRRRRRGNYSLGLVAGPAANFRLTLDALPDRHRRPHRVLEQHPAGGRGRLRHAVRPGALPDPRHPRSASASARCCSSPTPSTRRPTASTSWPLYDWQLGRRVAPRARGGAPLQRHRSHRPPLVVAHPAARRCSSTRRRSR